MRRFSATPDVSDDDSWSGPDTKKKKRRSRWADNEVEKSIMSGLPTTIPQGLTKEQEEQYLLQLQVEEITRRLRTGELGIPVNPGDRSPSPEPIYNQEGKRLNTREYRTRKKLEEERHHLIQKVLKLNVDYKPPADYRPPLIRVSDRVNIPQEEHPEINFVGLLIGPRGNTLRNIEKETGTTIIIRGKGSVKEGKVGYKDGRPLPAQDEPLHAYITAGSAENVKKAVDKIKQIIEEGIMVPDADNDLRKQQLRELALLNGTLRENDALTKLKQYQEAQTIITNTILCSICGGAGHIAQDCKQKKPGESLRAAIANAPVALVTPDRAKMDNEYLSLMAELGQGPPPPNFSRTSSSSFMPALPMLGVNRPILSLPAPNGNSDQSNQSNSSSTSASVNIQPPTFPPPGGFMRAPLNLPPPTMPVPPPGWTPAPVPPPTGLMPPDVTRPPAISSFTSNVPPSVPPPSLMSVSSVPPPWRQQFNASGTTSGTPTSKSSGNQAPPAMMPPPPPPPFCAQPVPPWQQAMTGMRQVPPPPAPAGQGPPPSWGMPPPVPPPSFPPWQQQHQTSTQSSSGNNTSTMSATSSGASVPSGYSLPMNIGMPPPPPPPN